MADAHARPEMTVVSWNCQKACAGDPLWVYLLELDPDVALLQEVGELPKAVLDRFDCELQRAAGKNGSPLPSNTAILARGRIGDAIPLEGYSPGVDLAVRAFAGDLVAREVHLSDGVALKVISVYCPAHELDPDQLPGLDMTIKLSENPYLWLTEVLWACLKQVSPSPAEYWIVGGDLNSSPTLDEHRPWAGNSEVLLRMAGAGFVECLARSQGRLTPTYRFPSRPMKHQLDHLFVTPALLDRLTFCTTGSRRRVFDGGLSDHLPVIAQFAGDSALSEDRRVMFPSELRDFIGGQSWTFAKTMREWPHEYIVREGVDARLFEDLVAHIRGFGREGRYYDKTLTYYEEAGLTYWTMGAPLAETTVVNRCRSEDTYEARLARTELP